MGRTIHHFSSSLIAAACFAVVTPALAQSEGTQSDWAPKGVAIGSFRSFQSIYTGIFFDDNVYRTSASKFSDVALNAGGSLNILSNWNNHALNLRVGADHLEFKKAHRDSRTAWNAAIDGRLDIKRGYNVRGESSYTTQFEPRNSANTADAILSPIRYRTLRFAGAALARPGRIGFELGGEYNQQNFDNATLQSGGVLDNKDRNMRTAATWAKALYQLSPGYSTFVRATYNDRKFDRPVDRSGANRSSYGYAADAGVDLEVTALIRGNFYAGWFRQHYRAPLRDVDGFNFGAALVWQATPRMAVTINAARRLTDTTIIGASTGNEETIGAEVDFDIGRNILVSGSVDYARVEYTGTIRKDELLSFGAHLKYMINDYISAEGRYTFVKRDSNATGGSFDDNTLTARINLSL